MNPVIVVIGAGSIGQAIARRIGAGKHLLVANVTNKSAVEAAETLADAGFDVTAVEVDISSRASVQALVDQAHALGKISGLVHAAGVSPSQAPIGRSINCRGNSAACASG